MDGIEATEHIRGLGYKEPIVALTANAVAGQADIFLQNGFDEFISKPIDIRQLNAVLNKLVRDKQPPEVIAAARANSNTKELVLTSQADRLLLESFIRDTRKALGTIGELYLETGEEAMTKYTVFVHGMKNPLFNVGEKELSELALSLEKAGRERNTDIIKRQTPEFLEKLQVVLKTFEAKLEQANSDNNTEDIDIEKLRSKLSEIKEMCAEYNRKGVLDALAEIKNCPADTRVFLDAIKKYVFNSDFEEAEEDIATYLANLESVKAGGIKTKEVAGLDIGRGLERYGGDEAVYLKVLHSYATSTRVLLEEVKSVGEENLHDYRIKVHGIKGSSLDLFAEQVGEAARALEQAAKDGDMSYINENNPPFCGELERLLDTLDALFVQLNEENPKPVKDKPDDELLAKLLEACKAFDMDGVDAAMEEIEKYSYQNDDGLVSFLIDKADMMNFGEIVKKLSK
jgi:CheY-like chemotaxis protein